MYEGTDIEALFAEALELDPKGREQLFDRVRRLDRDTADRLRQYVEVLESRPGFLTTPPEITAADLEQLVGTSAEQRSRQLGSLAFLSARDRIAGYELVRVIGFGGMGVVYEAIQQQPRRRVALKLLRAIDASPSALRRFEAEAEILARLRHPAIAQVFEAGVETLEGETIPFLAMELIHGARTIVEYVDEQGLDQQACLRLFLDVAAAVEHAHAQGVIHRDLKPANILIDDGGRPKIIDFGIARIVDGDEATADVTQTRGVLGTISYISPEQLGADDRAVDRRTDVYALGVVLYELLCKSLPYDLEQSSLPEALRAVVHQEPIAPSARGVNLDRDLETVLLKALRKTREDRYDSAEAFAADLRRYLNHVPIAARPPSLTYRLRLLSRRRPGLVASVLVAAVLLTAGAGISSWLWIRAERLQRQADSVRSELQEVRAALGADDDSSRSDFEPFASGILASVEQSLAVAQSDEERARLLTWAVDTLQRLEPQGGDDPELLAAIAETYRDLGDAYGSEWEAGPEKVAGAVGAHRRATEIFAGLVKLDPRNPELRARLAGSQIRLAQTLRKLSRFDEAHDAAQKSVENATWISEQKPDDTSATSTLIAALWARGDALIGTGPAEKGLEDAQRAEQLSRGLLAQDPESVQARCLLAWSSFRTGAWYMYSLEEPRKALEAFTEANDQRLELVQMTPEHPDVASDLLWYTVSEIELLEQLQGPSPAADRLRQFLDGAAVAARASATEVRLAPSYAELVRRLGRLLVAAGRSGEAAAAGAALLRHLESLEATGEQAETLARLRADAGRWTAELQNQP